MKLAKAIRQRRSTRAWPTSGPGSSGRTSRQASRPVQATSAAADASGWFPASAASAQRATDWSAATESGAPWAGWEIAGAAPRSAAATTASRVDGRVFMVPPVGSRSGVTASTTRKAPFVPQYQVIAVQWLTFQHLDRFLQPVGVEAAARLQAPLSCGAPSSRPRRRSRWSRPRPRRGGGPPTPRSSSCSGSA